jgi:hypothetical protein
LVSATTFAGTITQYIEGRFRRSIAVGNTYGFPVGIAPNASFAAATQMLLYTANAGTGVVESSFTRNAGGTVGNATTCGALLNCVADHGYWNLDAVSGMTSPDYNLSLTAANINAFCAAANSDYVIAARANGAGLSAYQYAIANANVCTVNNYNCALGAIPRQHFNSLGLDLAIGRLFGEEGLLAASASHCGTTNNGTLTVGSSTAAISNWLYNSGAGWQNIANTTNTYNYLNLANTTQYKVAFAAANCYTAESNTVIITIHPRPIAGTCSVVNDLCQTNAGALTLSASAGTPPYNVSWLPNNAGVVSPQVISTSGGTLNLTNLHGNTTYNFTVTDANGCTAQ